MVLVLNSALLIADEVLVMYADRPVETVSKAALFSNPVHPNTQGLMN